MIRNTEITREELMQAPAGAINYIKMPRQATLKGYNLTPAMYTDLLRRENFCCGICRQVGDLYIDHDHLTGKVRGLLCCRCNSGMGFIDSGLTDTALAYKKQRS